MNRLFSAKPLLAAAIAIGALGAATAAQARSDVVFSIGINTPYVTSAPVYYEPAPVYYQSAPVYVRPAPVYYQTQPVYYVNQHRGHNRRGAWGDADHDGVPNRYDRAPGNPYLR